MDQPKIERVLRLMLLMTGNVYYTVEEMAKKLDTSSRTIYRYIDTFKAVGFAVEKIHPNVYKLMEMPEAAKPLENLVYFSEEEARVVAGLIQGLSHSNGMKASLHQKLAAIFDITDIDRYTDNSQIASNIQALKEAVSLHRQVRLKDYASSTSGVHDVIAEPFSFTGEYVDVVAFDTVKMDNRIYKIARIGSVDILQEGWHHEEKHKKPLMDIFRMTGHDLTPVKVEMTLRAKNLLVEEFPLAAFDLSQNGNKWVLKTMVTRMEGVGRFVVGLAKEVRIIDSPELRTYIKDYSSALENLF